MKPLHRKTKNLNIRPLEAGDFGTWRAANLSMKKPRNKWDLGPKPESKLTRAEFKKLLTGQRRNRKADTFYTLAVFDRQGAMIGSLHIMEVSRRIAQTAFLGYSIFNNYWGMGYGKEAVKACFDIGFKDVKLHRLEAGIEPRNKRSIALAKSLGMRHEGLKKRAIYLRKKWVDLLIYSVTTEDYGVKFDDSAFRTK